MATYTLAVDAATARASAALIRDGTLVQQRTVEMRAEDEEPLMPAIIDCCDAAGVQPGQLDRVVCGAGPGSFTSLRIAASIAKGLALAVGCPLFAVSSLVLSVAGVHPPLPAGGYLSVLDAHRGELYALDVDVLADGRVVAPGSFSIVAASDASSVAAERGRRLVGPGLAVDAVPSAAGVAVVLGDVVAAGAVDLVAWEPSYGRAPEAQVRWEKTHGRPLRT